MSSVKLIAVFIFVVTMMTSCSFYRLGLRYFEWLTVREVDKSFDLTSDQKKNLESVVSQQMPWFRKVWTPELIVVFQELNTRWSDGLSEADSEWFFGKMRVARMDVVAHIAADLAPIAITFSPFQLGYAAKQFGKRNERWSEMLALSDEKLTKRRREKLRDSFAFWYSDITESQADVLCSLYGCARADIQRMLDYSMDSQAGFLGFLRDTQDPKQWTKTMIDWSDDGTVMLPPLKRETWRAAQLPGAKRLAQFDQQTTPEQRSALRSKLKEITDDLTWFSQQAVSASH